MEKYRKKSGFARIDEVRVKNCRTKDILVDALVQTGFAVDVMAVSSGKEPFETEFVLTVYRRASSSL